MDANPLQDRIDKLELDLKTLQSTVAASTQASASKSRVGKLTSFLIGNWVLLSFVAALSTATYVKVAYGVDYFRDYRNIQSRTRLTTFYTDLGNVLMGRGELPAAEEAFRNAVQIDNGNLDATMGLLKSQLFKPTAGADFSSPETIDARLGYYIKRYPDDAQLMFLKGLRLEAEQNSDEAIVWYKKAIATNPKAQGGYSQLAYLYMNQSHFNLEDATSNLKKALELDPDLGELYENLGYIYLVTLDLPQAEKYLLRGYQLSPSWEKACSLADSFHYRGDLTNAINFREWALHNLETAKPNDYVVGSESTEPHAPHARGS